MKDLLFGAADNYTWNQVKPWAESIRESGFDGDVALLVYRADMDVFAREAEKLDIDIYHIESDNWGRQIDHNAGGRDTQSHQMRFFHLWQLLSTQKGHAITTPKKYRYVIATDTRDVIFQRNPSEWLERNLVRETQIVAPSEGVLYRWEPWNLDNLSRGFGPYITEECGSYEVFNVGTIAARETAMRELAFMIFSIGEGRYIPNDQSGFSLLMNGGLLDSLRAGLNSAWAAPLRITHEPGKYTGEMLEAKPIIKDGWVYTSNTELFYIVHQWDSVPELKSIIEERYGV